MRRGWRNDPAWVEHYAKRDRERARREMERKRLEVEIVKNRFLMAHKHWLLTGTMPPPD